MQKSLTIKKIFVKSCNGSFVLPIEVKYGEVISEENGIVMFSDGRWCQTRPEKGGDTYWQEVSEAPSFEEESSYVNPRTGREW